MSAPSLRAATIRGILQPMVPKRASSVLCLLSLLLAASPCYSRDMTGKAAVGVTVTSTGMPMLTLRYWRTRLGLELMTGWRSHRDAMPSVTVQDGKRVLDAGAVAAPGELVAECTALVNANELAKQAGARSSCTGTLELSTLRLAAGVLWRVGDAPRASLSIGLRPWVQLSTETLKLYRNTALGKDSNSGDGNKTNNLATLWGVDLPLQAEAFLTDHASLNGHVALSVGYGTTPSHAASKVLQDAHGVWLGTSGVFSGGAGFSYYF